MKRVLGTIRHEDLRQQGLGRIQTALSLLRLAKTDLEGARSMIDSELETLKEQIERWEKEEQSLPKDGLDGSPLASPEATKE